MKIQKEEAIIIDSLPKLLTPKDVQKIFGMGKNQAYALMNSAAFPTIRLNNRMYVEVGALMQWLETYKGKTFLFSY